MLEKWTIIGNGTNLTEVGRARNQAIVGEYLEVN